jgi:hypothetical protein
MTEHEWFHGDSPTAMAEALNSLPVGERGHDWSGKAHTILIHTFATRIPVIADHPEARRFLAALGRVIDSWPDWGDLRRARRRLEKYLRTRELTGDPAEDSVSLCLRSLANVGVRNQYLTCGVVAHWFHSAATMAKPPVPYFERDACSLLRCVFGNPFRPATFDPKWRTEHTTGLALKMYDDREFTAMPILADALEEAGCDNADILSHCREPGAHVRGCWVVDLVLGKS